MKNARIKLIESLIHWNEKVFFYPKLKKFYARVLGEKVLILDVGANRGQSILFFKSIRSNIEIFSFEANPSLAKFLLQKFTQTKGVHIINKGISDKNGFMELNEGLLDLTSTFEPLNFNSKYLVNKSRILGVSKENVLVKKINVEVITLKRFIQENNIQKVDLLKIDTEGHEYKCLLGLFPLENCKIERIQLEKHTNDMYLEAGSNEQIESLLQNNGFYREAIFTHGFGGIQEIVYRYNPA